MTLSFWFLSPLRGSTISVSASPGSLSLTRGYYPPPLPGWGTCVPDGPGEADETYAPAKRSAGIVEGPGGVEETAGGEQSEPRMKVRLSNEP